MLVSINIQGVMLSRIRGVPNSLPVNGLIDLGGECAGIAATFSGEFYQIASE